MEALAIRKTDKTVIIELEKSSFSNQSGGEPHITNLLTQIRTEYLIHKADFHESIEELGDEIKRDWWNKNKTEIMEKIENFEKND